VGLVTILKVIKRLIFDVWKVPVDLFWGVSIKKDFATQGVGELEKDGLYIFRGGFFSESELTKLRGTLTGLLSTTQAPTSGQLTGRVFSHGVLAPDLEWVARRFLKYAQGYLSVRNPKLELMYYQDSFPVSGTDNIPGGEFHIDNSRANIKFMLYLTDVTTESGPFCYCPGTHGFFGIKKFLMGLKWELFKVRSTLYAGENLSIDLEQNAVDCLGDAGTVVAVDTTGWHKAKAVKSGARSVLVVSFNRF